MLGLAGPEKIRNCGFCFFGDSGWGPETKKNPAATRRKRAGKKRCCPRFVARSCQLPGAEGTAPRLLSTSSVHLYRKEALKTSRSASEALSKCIFMGASRN